jgi:hypothetical protein
MEVSGQLHTPATLCSENGSQYLLCRGCVDSRAILDTVENRKVLATLLDIEPWPSVNSKISVLTISRIIFTSISSNACA